MSKYLITIFLLIVAFQNLDILRSTYRIGVFSAVDIAFTYGVAFIITALPYDKVKNVYLNFTLLVMLGILVHVAMAQETPLIKVIAIIFEMAWLLIRYALCQISLFFGITSICEYFIDIFLS
jgi:hypothetical protein